MAERAIAPLFRTQYERTTGDVVSIDFAVLPSGGRRALCLKSLMAAIGIKFNRCYPGSAFLLISSDEKPVGRDRVVGGIVLRSILQSVRKQESKQEAARFGEWIKSYYLAEELPEEWNPHVEREQSGGNRASDSTQDRASSEPESEPETQADPGPARGKLVPIRTEVFQYGSDDYPIQLFWGSDVGIGKPDEFVAYAEQVCKAMGVGDASKALSRLKENEKGTNIVRTLGGPQKRLMVTERGIYRLAMTGRSEQAIAFQDLVTEVFVEIRKNGKVDFTQAQPSQSSVFEALLSRLVDNQIQNNAQIASLESKIDAVEPKMIEAARQAAADVVEKVVEEKVKPYDETVVKQVQQNHFQNQVLADRVEKVEQKLYSSELMSVADFATKHRIYGCDVQCVGVQMSKLWFKSHGALPEKIKNVHYDYKKPGSPKYVAGYPEEFLVQHKHVYGWYQPRGVHEQLKPLFPDDNQATA